ncbi:MAG TPA: succinate dehydrogenase, cytochrome b556 subunit [Steroidobacteraceae bacterium]|nr:succinate dehydrogenase, cytochrome b556 subunit [Steroidobacteraceae bacterium]
MNQRPLSPHLGIYKFAYTMALSILHRIMGVALSVGFLVLVWWLFALAKGPAAYAEAVEVLRSGFFKLLLAGWALAFIYHFCNGIRHLLWDAGAGLERREARRSGALVVVATFVLFALFIWAVYFATPVME